jgi:hypothetical protein
MQFRNRLGVLAAVGAMGASLLAGHLYAADKGGALTVSDVMKRAFKGKEKSTFAQITAGKGTAEQKKQLVEYCEALAAAKPEKGDQADWNKRTGDMLAAAKKVAGGDDKALTTLKNAANCKGCHDLHKE